MSKVTNLASVISGTSHPLTLLPWLPSPAAANPPFGKKSSKSFTKSEREQEIDDPAVPFRILLNHSVDEMPLSLRMKRA